MSKRSPTRIQGSVNRWLGNWAVENKSHKVQVRAEVIGDQVVAEAPSVLFQDQLSAGEMRALIAIKGWTLVDLASHWEMDPATLSRLIRNSSRPRYVDDMVWGLAPYCELHPDGWRKRLAEMATDVMRDVALAERTHPVPKVTSFTRSVGGFPGRLVDTPPKGRTSTAHTVRSDN